MGILFGTEIRQYWWENNTSVTIKHNARMLTLWYPCMHACPDLPSKFPLTLSSLLSHGRSGVPGPVLTLSSLLSHGRSGVPGPVYLLPH